MQNIRGPVVNSPPDVRETFLNQLNVQGAMKEMQRL